MCLIMSRRNVVCHAINYGTRTLGFLIHNKSAKEYSLVDADFHKFDTARTVESALIKFRRIIEKEKVEA
jgi:hypothetical protein